MRRLLIGTRRGVFFAQRNGGNWNLGDPTLTGQPIYTLACDTRKGLRIYAGRNDAHWGPGIRYSDDLGATWKESELQPRFPEGGKLSVEAIWQVVPSTAAEPDVLYAGVMPAALFKSTDRGVSWHEITALSQHPTREKWMPGNGGLCLHSILVDETDAQHLLVGISSVGVFETRDGGAHWDLCNVGLPKFDTTEAAANQIGSCIHRIAFAAPAAGKPERIYQQNHIGAFVRDENGPWVSIQNGLPSDFGFPLVAHPTKRDSAYVIPLESAWFRAAHDGKPAVYATQDGGKSWARFDRGLSTGDYNGILRDAMTIDRAVPCSVYFGTNGGRVFASADEGESWETVAAGLPPVYSVRVLND